MAINTTHDETTAARGKCLANAFASAWGRKGRKTSDVKSTKDDKMLTNKDIVTVLVCYGKYTYLYEVDGRQFTSWGRAAKYIVSLNSASK